MRLMFLATVFGAIVYILTIKGLTWLNNRYSILLFNSSIAIIVSGCLVKGIIEISGRTTTFETPYWWGATFFFVLSIGRGIFSKK